MNCKSTGTKLVEQGYLPAFALKRSSNNILYIYIYIYIYRTRYATTPKVLGNQCTSLNKLSCTNLFVKYAYEKIMHYPRLHKSS